VRVKFITVKCEGVNKLAKNVRVKNGTATNVRVKTVRIKFMSVENDDNKKCQLKILVLKT